MKHEFNILSKKEIEKQRSSKYKYLVMNKEQRDQQARRQQKYFTVCCVVLYLMTQLL